MTERAPLAIDPALQRRLVAAPGIIDLQLGRRIIARIEAMANRLSLLARLRRGNAALAHADTPIVHAVWTPHAPVVHETTTATPLHPVVRASTPPLHDIERPHASAPSLAAIPSAPVLVVAPTLASEPSRETPHVFEMPPAATTRAAPVPLVAPTRASEPSRETPLVPDALPVTSVARRRSRMGAPIAVEESAGDRSSRTLVHDTVASDARKLPPPHAVTATAPPPTEARVALPVVAQRRRAPLPLLVAAAPGSSPHAPMPHPVVQPRALAPRHPTTLSHVDRVAPAAPAMPAISAPLVDLPHPTARPVTFGQAVEAPTLVAPALDVQSVADHVRRILAREDAHRRARRGDPR